MKSNLRLLCRTDNVSDSQLSGSSATSEWPGANSVDQTLLSTSMLCGPAELRNIMVFEQGHGQMENSGFRFIGYFKVTNIELHEPQSKSLIQMLKKKFTAVDENGSLIQKERLRGKWQRSLTYQWAEVSFAVDDDANNLLPPPTIKVKPAAPAKDVNTLLRELRAG